MDDPTNDQAGGDLVLRTSFALAGEFVGMFGIETVERCVRDSYRLLADGATVTSHLPILAQRLARDRLMAAARTQSIERDTSPAVLFVCARNSSRSQMAAGWMRHLRSDVAVWSAGTEPSAELSPAVISAMQEVGIDLTDAYPKPLTEEVVAVADVVVTMGCGEVCPVLPGRRYEDWILAHPVGSTTAAVRSARDEIRERVELLLATLDSSGS